MTAWDFLVSKPSGQWRLQTFDAPSAQQLAPGEVVLEVEQPS